MNTYPKGVDRVSEHWNGRNHKNFPMEEDNRLTNWWEKNTFKGWITDTLIYMCGSVKSWSKWHGEIETWI